MIETLLGLMGGFAISLIVITFHAIGHERDERWAERENAERRRMGSPKRVGFR